MAQKEQKTEICRSGLLEHLVVGLGEEIQKVVPLQAWSGLEGSRKLRFPDFTKTAQDGSKVVKPTHRPPLPFLSEAESTPGLQCGR